MKGMNMIAQLTSPVTEAPLERLDELYPREPSRSSARVRRVRRRLILEGVDGVLADYERRGAMDVAADRVLDACVTPNQVRGIPSIDEQLAATLPVERKMDGDE